MEPVLAIAIGVLILVIIIVAFYLMLWIRHDLSYTLSDIISWFIFWR